MEEEEEEKEELKEGRETTINPLQSTVYFKVALQKKINLRSVLLSSPNCVAFSSSNQGCVYREVHERGISKSNDV